MTPVAAMLLLRGLDLLLLGIEVAPDVAKAFGEISSDLKKIILERRDPTDEEFAKLMALADAVHQKIQEGGS